MVRVQGRSVFSVLAIVFGALGLVALVIAGVLAVNRAATIAGYRHGEGVVVGLRSTGRGSFAPVVKISSPGGSAGQFSPFFGSNPPGYAIGDRVRVIYSPSNPSHAFIDSFWQIWIVPLFPAFFGAGFGLPATGFFIANRVRKRKIARIDGDQIAF